MSNAFDKLAPFIQDYIYDHRWEQLRDIQVAACDVIFNTQNNLLLAAGTASGKTEAAFLPALTEIYNKPSSSIGILYISPLKALINDQFIRLEGLLEESHIPVVKWHGEANQTKKRKTVDKPQGVMQTTPESLEALLKNRSGDVEKLFKDLRFVIIDEIHAFMGSSRGIQLLSILQRIQRVAECNPRRIGLSATLGDYSVACNFLDCGSPYKSIVPNVQPSKQKVQIGLAYIPCLVNKEQETIDKTPYFEFMYDLCDNKKCIIFANEKQEVEKNISYLKQINESRNGNNTFLVHHGSIARGLRETTEATLKQNDNATTVSATVTLELGIDIGSLDLVVQAGSPFTVSSFVQRLGRSGRRTGLSRMCFLFSTEKDQRITDDTDYIRWDFIKSIAIIQLYTKEKWIEPPYQEKFPFSVLYHQTMSILYGQGEMSPAKLAETVLTLNVFKNVTQDDFKIFLNHLIDTNHLSKTENGTLIIGNEGEKVVNYFDFFSVFKTPREYVVKHGAKTIGTVDQKGKIDDAIALAGLNWKIIDINDENQIIFVEPIKGITETKWRGRCQFITHTKLMKQIQQILLSDEQYPYLNKEASELLTSMRQIARGSGYLTNQIVELESKQYGFFPWLGTKAMNALCSYFISSELECKVRYNYSLPLFIKFDKGVKPKDIQEKYNDLINGKVTNVDVPEDFDCILPDEKFNDYIPGCLLQKEFFEDFVDISEVIGQPKTTSDEIEIV